MNFVSSLVACVRAGVLGRAELPSPVAKPLFRRLVSTATRVSLSKRQWTSTAEARTRFTPSKEARKTRSLLFAVLLLAAILAPQHSRAQIQVQPNTEGNTGGKGSVRPSGSGESEIASDFRTGNSLQPVSFR
jgi:hypothetical protein